VGSSIRQAGGGCTQNTDARFIGFNRGSSSFVGAGTQLASYALGVIQDHVSATSRSGSPLRPKGLTFSNAGAAIYGGDLADSHLPGCLPDYFGNPIAPVLSGNQSIASRTLGTN